ncbi:encapsulin [Streptomyces sp. FR-108]|uniref:encapsulin n=1 Tax=Streptomyces sp. FR-108 TaxID=3416665 RepID=UPI003CEEF85D
MTTRNLGRDKLPWSEDRWRFIDQAVHDEAARTRIGRRFMPIVPLADVLTAPADTIVRNAGVLTVPEAMVTPLVELWVEFSLTKQQVEAEDDLATTVTLATRAANLLAQGEDLLIFQGNGAIENAELFLRQVLKVRAGPPGPGLADPDALEKDQVIVVPPTSGNDRFGENTFTSVSQAYALLQQKGHYGPYTLVLPTVPYADTFAPLTSTLIMPADRIRPLVEDRLFGTGTLEAHTGVLASLGGNTLDFVVGRDATTAFVQEDSEGLYRFRVFERFALRDKARSSRILLKFLKNPEGLE